MKALVSASTERPEVALVDLPDPVPAPGEALVEVKAVSINRGEVRAMPGTRDPELPNGWDLAGVVRRPASDGSGPAKGARVVGLVSPQGAWAELVAVPTVTLAEIPGPVSFEEAATLPVAGLTALRTLELAGFVAADEIAITGASGGFGRFAVQLARLGGANVTAFARRQTGLRELGADKVQDTITAQGPRFRAIIECIGGPALGNAVQRVRPGGIVITLANTVPEDVVFPTRAFYGGAPAARIHAFIVFTELRRNDNSGSADLGRLLRLVADGRLKTSIDLTVPFDEAQKAIDALLAGDVRGKAVLTL